MNTTMEMRPLPPMATEAAEDFFIALENSENPFAGWAGRQLRMYVRRYGAAYEWVLKNPNEFYLTREAYSVLRLKPGPAINALSWQKNTTPDQANQIMQDLELSTKVPGRPFTGKAQAFDGGWVGTEGDLVWQGKEAVRVKGTVFDLPIQYSPGISPEAKGPECQFGRLAKDLRFPVILTDSESRIIEVNPAFTQVCGWRLDEVRRRLPKDLLQGERTNQVSKYLMHEAVRTEKIFYGPVTNYTKPDSRNRRKQYDVDLIFGPVFTIGRQGLQSFVGVAATIDRSHPPGRYEDALYDCLSLFRNCLSAPV